MGKRKSDKQAVRAPRGSTKIAVSFRGLSAGGKTSGSIAFSIAADNEPDSMDDLFLNTAVQVMLSLNPSTVKDAEGQQELGEWSHKLTVVGTSRGYGKSELRFTCSLGFNKWEVPLDELKRFTGHEGTIHVLVMGSVLPDDEADIGDDENDDG